MGSRPWPEGWVMMIEMRCFRETIGFVGEEGRLEREEVWELSL